MKHFLKISFLILALFAGRLEASTIPVSATFKNPQGNTINGKFRLTLSYTGAQDFTDNTLVAAQPVEFPVNNGGLPSTARITPNDRIRPSNTTYMAELFNSFGSRIFRANFYVSGSSYAFSQATPTPITTSNISFTNAVIGSGVVDCIPVWITTTSLSCADNLTGDTAEINNADGLTINNVIVPVSLPISFHAQTPGAMVNQSFFISNQPYQVVAIQWVHATAETTAANLRVQITKETGTSAPGTGGVLLTNNSNLGFNAKSTANVVQSGTLTATVANLQIQTGDRLSVSFETTATELAGVTVVVFLKRI